MFTKIHLAFYDLLFELYGKLHKHYKSKGREDKIRKCIDQREELLDIMFTLKGLS